MRLKLPAGAGSQFDVSVGLSFWIKTVSEPSGLFFNPSVVLPKLKEPSCSAERRAFRPLNQPWMYVRFTRQ